MTEASWQLVSRLGELQIMLPALLAAAFAIGTRSRRFAACWLAASLAAIALTATSKIAFIGYGFGLAAIDFTGISGHAMMASAVLPLLLLLAAGIVTPRARAAGLALGIALAIAVALSRVRLGAHSWSEVAAGLVIGAGVTSIALGSGAVPVLQLPRVLAVAMVGALLLALTQMPESRTHDAVTQLALSLSGRSQPYTRWHLHHRPLRASAAAWPGGRFGAGFDRRDRCDPRQPELAAQRAVARACASIVSASLTSNLPGPSMFKVLTTPSSTSIE